jgi:hypothetical protein
MRWFGAMPPTNQAKVRSTARTAIASKITEVDGINIFVPSFRSPIGLHRERRYEGTNGEFKLAEQNQCVGDERHEAKPVFGTVCTRQNYKQRKRDLVQRAFDAEAKSPDRGSRRRSRQRFCSQPSRTMRPRLNGVICHLSMLWGQDREPQMNP